MKDTDDDLIGKLRTFSGKVRPISHSMTSMPKQNLFVTTLALAFGLSLHLTSFAADPSPAPSAKAEAKAATSPGAGAKKEKKDKKDKTGPLPFRGKVVTVNKGEKSFTIKSKKAERTFRVTDTSKITNKNAPAKFEDITEGAEIRGSSIRTGKGKFDVITGDLGSAQPAAKDAAKKAAAEEAADE